MFSRLRSSRSSLVIAGLLVIGVLAAAAVLLPRLITDGSVKTGGGATYTEAVAGTWQRINPIYADLNEVDSDLSSLVFSGLVKLGTDGSLQPDLADLPDVSDAGKTYTFHLKHGLTWQDGVALTSQDVSFTIAKVVDPDFKGDPAMAQAWQDVTVETPDGETVVMHLKQASAPFLARSATLGILPEHLLKGLSAAALFEAPFNSAPVGSGPYRLTSVDAHQAKLIANAASSRGRPGIDNVVLKFYTDYPSALRALTVGEVQGLMVEDPLSDAQLADIGRLKGVKVDQPQLTAEVVLYLNNDQSAYFADERVRRAISLALDRQAIVDQTMQGLATGSSSPIAPGTWSYASEYDSTSPDLATARQLLDDAGWKLQPTTGILVKEGAEFRFTIRTDDDPVRMAIAGAVSQQLDQIGIKATVASTTFSVLRRDFLSQRKYDAAIAVWDEGTDPDPYFGWHSSQMGTAGLNLANFADVVADTLIAQGRTSNDIETRKDDYRQFQEVWNELEPSVVIAYPRYTYIHTDQLKGYQSGPLFDPASRFTDIVHWKLQG
ncbi:MAG TPA: peptide ABC transporter substrate-binding protein [Tepidiformaceae bacterium]